uniref:Uncharacterized protein n=1 Tax=Biomphalaria glabrata TaxID=6526 RepID=A0A2C9KCH7_BIOGL
MKTVDAYLKVLEPVVIPTMPPRSNSDKSISMNEDFFSNRNDHSYSEADDEFDSDQFFETTKGPKKNRNKDKKGHNKDKKGHKKDKKTDKKEKDKMRIFEEEEERYLATTFATTSNTITIWSFNDDLNAGDELMTSPTSDEDSSKMASTIPPKAGHASVHKGTISSWTIYTIVGAVGGVILLIGLIAITLTVCCQSEEGGIYKSTPV